jgi:hypothetical protein
MQHAPATELARLAALLLAAGLGVHCVAMALWRRPSRRRLAFATVGTQAAFAVFVLGVRWRVFDASARDWFVYTAAIVAAGACIIFWFVVVYRVQQIAGRLSELAERERSLALARQLATAQIKPHFLFNTLASLQHWVDTGDARAGPMLASLTGYLRATLPLFERRTLTLAEELEAVRRYLEVIQARLGPRLRTDVRADPDVLGATLPPGVLLTLVENAVEHGVQPQLGGGTLRVRARRGDAGRVQIDVADDGPGLPLGLAPDASGTAGQLGLANTRARLAQVFGDGAVFELRNAPEGGCVARLSLPAAASLSDPKATPT